MVSFVIRIIGYKRVWITCDYCSQLDEKSVNFIQSVVGTFTKYPFQTYQSNSVQCATSNIKKENATRQTVCVNLLLNLLYNEIR